MGIQDHRTQKPDLDTLTDLFPKLYAQPEDEFDVGMSSIYYATNPDLNQKFTHN